MLCHSLTERTWDQVIVISTLGPSSGTALGVQRSRGQVERHDESWKPEAENLLAGEGICDVSTTGSEFYVYTGAMNRLGLDYTR